VCFHSKDPQGSEVDIIEENDDTEIFSFPDFKIPPNPKYVKTLVNEVFSRKHIWNFCCEANKQSNGAT
jgi:hypothetical protein